MDAPRAARRALDDFLASASVPPQPEAALVLAEAVALVGMGRDEAVALRLELAEGRLRGTVAASGGEVGSEVEHWRHAWAPDLAERLIDDLADRWGAEDDPGQLWFEIVIPR